MGARNSLLIIALLLSVATTGSAFHSWSSTDPIGDLLLRPDRTPLQGTVVAGSCAAIDMVRAQIDRATSPPILTLETSNMSAGCPGDNLMRKQVKFNANFSTESAFVRVSGYAMPGSNYSFGCVATEDKVGFHVVGYCFEPRYDLAMSTIEFPLFGIAESDVLHGLYIIAHEDVWAGTYVKVYADEMPNAGTYDDI